MARMQFKRGLKANLPTSGMLAGEAFFTIDRGTLHAALDATTRLPIVTATEDLAAMGAVNAAADMIIIHDADGAGQKEKRITLSAFKTALNIPASDTDEKAAIIAGGTAGYIWGTDGTDGILRLNSTLSWTKDAGNGFVTLALGDVDLGTF